ncbi:related to UPF0662 protein YPL260W [Saccharomycodes ludwigii]|uniref:Related to UPF0662 protein YPL260W n=1 Tax=Saccharomycodes ludwigii TaxID=36035 RepID=A0A376B3C7_9ASCO|nr:hypothetical protein SCDLUD_002499 [Saccharomycodes ludwigii]KAH3901029.1 hypothetical protein SCDLUD_002499 [Saccharomycodes ludwigii]SSD59183.1 related to UPF0662 protein YPL260W [Saccharomycodes ludwigii]
MSQYQEVVPEEEESILNYFLEVRNSLSHLKQDRKQYLNSKDVQKIYQQVLTQVRKLDAIRSKHNGPNASDGPNVLISNNRVDSVLDDVFQLLSLSFITVGLKNSAPATYASLSTVQRLLEHLEESKVYTHHDLRPIKERLNEISVIVTKNNYKTYVYDYDQEDQPEISEIEDKNKVEEDLLLRAKLKHCMDEYQKIENNIEETDPQLQSLTERLYSIRRNLLSLAAATRKTPGSSSTNLVADKNVMFKVKEYEKELSELESHRDEFGKFKSLETGKVVENGQNVLNGLLDDCHDLLSDLLHHHSSGLEKDPNLKKIYESLIEIKTSLENLLVTRRWTLRETDLFTYQKRLSDIDSMRVNGKFPTSVNGNGDPDNKKSQSILLYLLRRCYAIIYKLLESSEPVSESLQRIHNQLTTVRRCLLDLKRMGGVDSERELYPYQMKLASLDNLRTDGKFYDDDGNIPEGQGTLNALLSECFDILHELKIEAEEKEEQRERERSTAKQKIDSDNNLENNSDIIEESDSSCSSSNNSIKKGSDANTNSKITLDEESQDEDAIKLTKDSTTRDVADFEETGGNGTNDTHHLKYLNDNEYNSTGEDEEDEEEEAEEEGDGNVSSSSSSNVEDAESLSKSTNTRTGNRKEGSVELLKKATTSGMAHGKDNKKKTNSISTISTNTGTEKGGIHEDVDYSDHSYKDYDDDDVEDSEEEEKKEQGNNDDDDDLKLQKMKE